MNPKQGEIVIINGRKFVVISVETDAHGYSRLNETPRISHISVMEIKE